jgi:hypothetical protein
MQKVAINARLHRRIPAWPLIAIDIIFTPLDLMFATIPCGNLSNFDCERFRLELEGPVYRYRGYRFHGAVKIY